MNSHIPIVERGDPLILDITLQPQRSLTHRGFIILMSAIAIVSFLAGFSFFLAGAWPVFGFFGLDVALIYLAFKLNYRQARLRERLTMTERCFQVQRHHPGGRRETWTYQPYWLKAEARYDRNGDPHIILTSKGLSVAVGEFLIPEKREQLLQQIKNSLGQCPFEPLR